MDMVHKMIVINLDKAKEFAHQQRRVARSMEFEPLDSVIAKQIPGIDVAKIETERQAIRDKYKELQLLMDSATTINELKPLLPKLP
jgi:hypothetical protein